MARITVEDCLEKIPNRFELIHIAAKRVKQMVKGSKSAITGVHNKPAVMALREVAAGIVIKPQAAGRSDNGSGSGPM